MKHTQKGFTLVELLVVIAILAILATVSVVGYTAYIEKANNSAAMQEAQPFETMIKSEIAVNGYCKVATEGSTTYYAYNTTNGVVLSTAAPTKGAGSEYTSTSTFSGDVENITFDDEIKGSDTVPGTFKIESGKIIYTRTKGGTYTLFAN